MITCRELAVLLCDYVSDELPPERRDHVEQHAARCPSCAAYLQSYTLVVRLTRRLPAAPLPEGLAQRLAAALRRQRPAAGGA
ncbi:MAG TPA: zf-HC2 domain-containing protein [Gemmataceae bacterium]|nr:zf-HC2 domain-containing protein [Gemmataceae bacterium]